MSTLASGYRIGPFSIVNQLGVGGMGEVYRATDSNLGRQVAIKVLPPAFTMDADRLARFDREARTLAQLNHPNIAHVYGLERGADQIALVMELVEGPTLAEPLATGPLPLDEVLAIARQIAEALEAAHEQNIIHRDLKPANIKVRPDGTVKVLDFGLAKAVDPVSSISSSVSAPTITTPAMTQMGVILGTAAYMSPEQARGKLVDKRTDIWAFGCVLYEMLTGKRAFSGEDTTEVLARVIERDVDFSQVPASTPPTLKRLLRRCLEKDRKNRLTDIGVARLDIDELLRGVAEPTPAPVVAVPTSVSPARTFGRERLAWVAAVLVAAGAAGAGAYALRPSVPVPAEVQFQVPMGPMYQSNDLSVSPDGRNVAYAMVADNARQSVWVRHLDDPTPTMVPGSTATNRQPMNPFWSPDGRYLAFVIDGTLVKIENGGGAPQPLTKLDGQPGGGTWNRDGVILIASNGHGLRRISANGGPLEEVTTLDTAAGEVYHDAPQFLPDGKRFIYVVWGEKPGTRAIWAGTLGSKERTRVMDAPSNAYYAVGHLFFVQGRVLTAQPFDPGALKLTGQPFAVAQNVPLAGDEVGSFAVSDGGTIVYRSGVAQMLQRQVFWFDRSGNRQRMGELTVAAPSIRLSPDGTRLAWSEANGSSTDIWTYDIARDVRTRLTTDPAPDHNPTWSPDGTQIAFDSHRGPNGSVGLFVKPANGVTPEHLLIDIDPKSETSPRSWAPDGSSLVVSHTAADLVANLWRLPLVGDRTMTPFRSNAFVENEGVIAPNGHYLAYTTNESGRDEVVVQTWPDPTQGRWQVSADGGVGPRWRKDGKELYFVDPRGRLIAASVNIDGVFSMQRPVPLFETPLPLPTGQLGAASAYDVMPDGQKFVLVVPPGSLQSLPLTVRANWAPPGK